jgi:hypothetical protein
MNANIARARILFGAAAALYVLWIGALVVNAFVSGARPPERVIQHDQTPASVPATIELQKD